MNQRPQIFGKTLFVDLMMSTLVVVTALLIASNAAERQEKSEIQTRIEAEGKYVVILTWPAGTSDDVDLHVMSPNGNDVFFKSREVDLMHLDHDDLGSRGDSVVTKDGTTISDTNEERTTIRGVIPGEYVVNVHMFLKKTKESTTVTVVLYKLIGNDAEVVRKELVLQDHGSEMTAFRFTLEADESVGDINELPMKFIGEQEP